MARTNDVWETGIDGTYIQTIDPVGYNILINGSNKYLNFNNLVGSSGYGIRDNAGTMEFKNSGGSWTPFGSGSGGGNNINISQTPDTGTYSLLTGTVNGSNTTFTVNGGVYLTGKLVVYLNGVLQQNGLDFTETTPGSGTFDFATAPFTGDVVTALFQTTSGGGTVGPGTINEIAYFDTTTSIASLAVATYPSLTELSYVKGVTSAIQTQLNGKQASDTQLTSLAALSYTGNTLKVIRVNAGETDFELATISAGGQPITTITDSGTTLTVAGSLTTINCYVFTGASDTVWTLYAMSGNTDKSIMIKNRGTANITLQRAGADNIFFISSVTSFVIYPGEAYTVVPDGTFFNVF